MEVFEVVIALLVGGAALAAIARRIGAPYPALVALAGAALALIPGVPTLVLDPELALALFVAPVLVDAAFDSSPRDLRANWRPIASLALGAVAGSAPKRLSADAAAALASAGIPLRDIIVNRITPRPDRRCGWCDARRVLERRAIGIRADDEGRPGPCAM